MQRGDGRPELGLPGQPHGLRRVDLEQIHVLQPLLLPGPVAALQRPAAHSAALGWDDPPAEALHVQHK